VGNRPDRVGEAIRTELSELIAREVHDPGIVLLTLTRVSVTADLQLARVYYTSLGDEKAQQQTAKALARATPFLRRQIGARIRLRRVPELSFFYDRSIADTDRIEQILQDLRTEAQSREAATATEPDEWSGAGTPANESAGGAGGAEPPGKAGKAGKAGKE